MTYDLTDNLFYCVGWNSWDTQAAQRVNDVRGMQEAARKQAAALAMVDWLREGESIDR